MLIEKSPGSHVSWCPQNPLHLLNALKTQGTRLVVPRLVANQELDKLAECRVVKGSRG